MRATRTNQLLQRRDAGVDRAERRRRVVVVEDVPFAADRLSAELQEHRDVEVGWCRDADGEVTCGGIVNERCPLKEPVELVLDVRSLEGRGLSAGEVGVACAGVAGIPVVAAAPSRPEPNDVPWAVATCATQDAAEFCRHVLEHPGLWDEQRLEDLVRRVLRLRDADVGVVRLEVVPWPESLAVVVRSDRLPDAASCAAVDQALRAARPGLVGLSFVTSA